MKSHLCFALLSVFSLLAACTGAAGPQPTATCPAQLQCQPCPPQVIWPPCEPCQPTAIPTAELCPFEPGGAGAESGFSAPYLVPDRVAAVRGALEAVLALRDNDLERLAQLSTAYLTLSPSVESLEQAYAPYAEELRGFAADASARTWGADRAGQPLTMSYAEFRERFLYNLDYASAPVMTVNYDARLDVPLGVPWEIAGEPLPEANAAVVEFTYPAPEDDPQGWQTLRMVLRGGADGNWQLATLVHTGAEPPPGARLEGAPEAGIPPKTQALLQAMDAALALRSGDLAALADMAHPSQGVRFSPYAFVQEGDVVLSAEELRGALQEDATRRWGWWDGSGEPIEMSFADYYRNFVYDADFADLGWISLDWAMSGGNTIDNSREFYPGAVIVEFYHPGSAEFTGMDWSALRLVFQQAGERWYLVGVIHASWTI